MADIKQVVTIPQIKTLLTLLKSKFAVSVNGNKPDTSGKITIPTMTGATSTRGGTSGLVPAPAIGKQNTVLKGDGTWGDLSVMTGATTSANGKEGLVPQPAKGSATRYLRSDGTWSDISTMTGASTSADGVSGLVPTPSAGSSNRYLSASGVWQEVDVESAKTKLVIY